SLPGVAEWSDTEKPKFEKEALDFYLSSHPLAQHAEILRRFALHCVEELKSLPASTEVTLGGMLTQVRFMNTKKARNGNTRYLRCKLEDLTGAIECVMWPDDFARQSAEIHEDQVCVLEGTVERTREAPGLVVTRITSLDQAKRNASGDIRISLLQGTHGAEQIEQVAHLLERSPGASRVYLLIRDADGKKCLLKADERLRVDPGAALLDQLQMIVGQNRVEFRANLN